MKFNRYFCPQLSSEPQFLRLLYKHNRKKSTHKGANSYKNKSSEKYRIYSMIFNLIPFLLYKNRHLTYHCALIKYQEVLYISMTTFSRIPHMFILCKMYCIICMYYKKYFTGQQKHMCTQMYNDKWLIEMAQQ